MNSVNITGRITRDPEMKVTAGGNAVSAFSIACRRTYKNHQGEYDTDFIRCVAYGHQADYLCKYIKKGDLIGVGGAVRQYTYEGEDGLKHTGLEVVVGNGGNLEKLAAKQNSSAERDSFGEVAPLDDDIPF